MKKLIIPMLVFAVLAGAGLFAATYTRQNTRIEEWHSHVFYASDGTVERVDVRVEMLSRLVNDADSADVVNRPAVNVSFNLLDDSIKATNITAAGKTVTHAQLAALMRQAALDRANAAGVQ